MKTFLTSFVGMFTSFSVQKSVFKKKMSFLTCSKNQIFSGGTACHPEFKLAKGRGFESGRGTKKTPKRLSSKAMKITTFQWKNFKFFLLACLHVSSQGKKFFRKKCHFYSLQKRVAKSELLRKMGTQKKKTPKRLSSNLREKYEFSMKKI